MADPISIIASILGPYLLQMILGGGKQDLTQRMAGTQVTETPPRGYQSPMLGLMDPMMGAMLSADVGRKWGAGMPGGTGGAGGMWNITPMLQEIMKMIQSELPLIMEGYQQPTGQRPLGAGRQITSDMFRRGG